MQLLEPESNMQKLSFLDRMEWTTSSTFVFVIFERARLSGSLSKLGTSSTHSNWANWRLTHQKVLPLTDELESEIHYHCVAIDDTKNEQYQLLTCGYFEYVVKSQIILFIIMSLVKVLKQPEIPAPETALAHKIDPKQKTMSVWYLFHFWCIRNKTALFSKLENTAHTPAIAVIELVKDHIIFLIFSSILIISYGKYDC